MTIAEEAPARDGPAPAGDNLSDEATFYRHVRAIVAANAKLDEAKAARNAVRKLARADGIELGALDRIIKMADWDASEIRDHFATEQRYAELMNLPVGTQLDLLDGVPEAARPDIDWKAKGFTAAMTNKGEFAKAPDNCPPDQVQNYLAGVHEAHEKIAGEMGTGTA